MSKINEQIERLRELVRKCYGIIASKNGTIPNVGERTMSNLGAAIESIPNSITDLVATENNKEYLPADYGVYGFGKVKTELPKVKVSALKINADCINEDGRWGGERLIDTSACTTLEGMCFGNSKIKNIDASGWNTSNVESLKNTFCNCINLGTIDVTGWDVSNVTNFYQVFYVNNSSTKRKIIGYEDWDVRNGVVFECTFWYRNGSSMDILDFRKWEIPNATSFKGNFFPAYLLIKSLVGGESLESVISNNTTILQGLKVGFKTGDRFYCEDRASLRALINGLADLTGQTTQTIGLNKQKITEHTTSAFDTLTEEDIAIAVAKNWTITSVG